MRLKPQNPYQCLGVIFGEKNEKKRNSSLYRGNLSQSDPQTWFGRGYAAEASEPIPMFRGHFGKKKSSLGATSPKVTLFPNLFTILHILTQDFDEECH